METQCLVITSCTGDKADQGCPPELKLTEDDFTTIEKRRDAELKAATWLKPAAEMYTGRQHRLMMDGLQRLRASSLNANFDLAIVSAGYGLLREAEEIAPYDITFKGKRTSWIRERGLALDIPASVHALVAKYQVVFYLLGNGYLKSIGTLPVPTPKQKFFYFGDAAAKITPPGTNTIIVPAGPNEVQRYGGAPITAMKGRMFSLLSAVISTDAAAWNGLLKDSSSETLLDILDQAATEPHSSTKFKTQQGMAQ